MDQNGVIYSAHNNSNSPGMFQVTARLPFNLDLSNGSYEVALLYTCFKPSWLKTHEIFLESVNSELESEKCVFAEIEGLDKEAVLNEMKNQLIAKFSTLDPRVKIEKVKGLWYLKIQKKSTVHLSKSLARMLSLPTVLKNVDETKQKGYKLLFMPKEICSHENIYYICCENVCQNFISHHGHHKRLVDYINLYNVQSDIVYVHTPLNIRYSRMEGGLTSLLSYSLYNSDGNPVYADNTDFLIFFHIRPTAGYEENKIV